jgi:hypothetical protein
VTSLGEIPPFENHQQDALPAAESSSRMRSISSMGAGGVTACVSMQQEIVGDSICPSNDERWTMDDETDDDDETLSIMMKHYQT